MVMRPIYTFFLYLFIPLLIIRLYWKGRRLPEYKHRIIERFAIHTKFLKPVDVWFHAVSLGEVNAAAVLIDELLAKGLTVCITTMTPTGSKQVLSRYGNKVQHQYLPYDLPYLLRRFFNAINPKLGVIMETELWPNVIKEAKRRQMPLVLANARISDKAFKQYYKVRCLFKPLLNDLHGVLAQSEEDASRFLALGAERKKVTVAGNLKFDVNAFIADPNRTIALKSRWGAKRPVLIAASTHEGEEAMILHRLSQLQTQVRDLLLIIAPRHPERFKLVYDLSVSMKYHTGLRSQEAAVNSTLDVLILDSIGELLSIYHLADYAFVGGSLVPIGGHNVLEPIALNVPVFVGPYMNNAKAICDTLRSSQAIECVKDADELMKAVALHHQHSHLSQQQIKNANEVLNENKGSVGRHMRQIESLLGS